MIEKQEIDENETITMTESFTVIGDIKSGAKIILQGKTPCTLLVQGEVGNNVKVVNHQGNIFVKNLGQKTFLTVHKGNISVGATATGCELRNYSGNITVETLSASRIKAHRGDVIVTNFGNNSELIVYEGNATIKKIESEDMKVGIQVIKGNLLISEDNAEHLKPEVFNGCIIDDENQISRANLGR